jgi:unsaturated rhamnogalacturonyl hydrolase
VHRAKLLKCCTSLMLVACASNETSPPSSGAAGNDSEASAPTAGGAGLAADATAPVGVAPDASASTTRDIESGAMAPSVEVGRIIADYMIARWPELDATAADCTGPENCFSMNFPTAPASPAPKFWEYTYGVPVYGVQKLYEKTGDARYLDYVKKYVDRYVDSSGRIEFGRSWPAGALPNDPTIQDVIQPSILLFGLYEKTGDARYLTAMAATRAVIDTIAKNPAGAFWHKPSYPNQQWLDGIYMTQPFLTKYGALYADDAKPGDAASCFMTATSQIELLAEHTFEPAKSLYYHAWNGAPDGKWLGLASPAKTAPLDGVAVSPVLWSRSIGWYIAGTVDTLESLPLDHAERAALITVVSNIAAGLQKYQDPATGLWYQVIDVMNGPLPDNGGYPGETVAAAPNWLETSASALFAYSLAKAVRLGILPSSYLDVARRGWSGVKSKIDLVPNGDVIIHGTVVGMSVGGTYNAYVNADFRSDLSGSLPAPAPTADCPATGTPFVSPPIACKYIYVRDNVPQGFGAVLLAASEMER